MCRGDRHLFEGGALINDAVGDLPIVLVGDRNGRTVRAYERGAREFWRASDGALSAGDEVWREEESALVSAAGERLPRVAGHVAYWFAWNNYLGPQGELVTR